MRQAYYFNAEFAEDEVHKVLNFIGTLQDGDEIDFYLHSYGGYNHVMETIKSILENCGYPVTIIAAGEIQSAAFLLFYFANVNKTILPNVAAVVHTLTIEFDDRETRRNTKYHTKTRKRLDEMNEKIIEAFRTYNVLSGEDLEDYIKGEDILLLADELKIIMQNCPYGKIIL